jgi:hypothetical protein
MSTSEAEELYKCIGDDGNIEFSNLPCDNPAEIVEVNPIKAKAEENPKPLYSETDEVYKCIGNDGNIIFSNLPCDNSAGTVEINPIKAEENLEPLYKAMSKEASGQGNDKCANFRSQLETVKTSKNVGITDADGNKRILSEEERQAYIEELEQTISKWCK